MKKTHIFLICFCVVIVVVGLLFSIPYLKTGIDKINEFYTEFSFGIFNAKQTVKLEPGRIEQKQDGNWHTPYSIVSDNKAIFSGETISHDDVYIPYEATLVKDNEVWVKYKIYDTRHNTEEGTANK